MELKQIMNDYVGDLGRYQIRLLCLLFLTRLPSVYYNMDYVFLAATPGHWCAYPQHSDHINLTNEEWKRFSIPAKKKNGQITYDKCVIYEWANNPRFNSSDVTRVLAEINNGTKYGDDVKKSCHVWEYDRVTNVRSSFVTEWDMVCNRKWMKTMIPFVFVLAWIIGGYTIGYFSDRWGRRVMLRILVVGTAVFGISGPFASHYVAFLVLRFLLSACMNPASGICFAFCLELVGDRWRSLVTNLYMIGWAIGYASVAGIAYFLRDRFYFMITISALMSVMVIPVWFLPESLTWLIAKGRQEEANKIIRRMARANKKPLPHGLSVTVEQENYAKTAPPISKKLLPIGDMVKVETKTKTKWLDLVRTPGMRKMSLLLWVNWIANGLLYFAISWNASDFHGDLYLNVFLSGLVEIPAYLLNIPLVSKVGRRWGMAGCTYVAGITLLLSLAVPDSIPAGKVTLVMIAKFTITMSFTIAYQYSVELYPTVTRTHGLLASITAARFGNIVSPFLPLLGGVWQEVICGTFALAVGSLLLLLPETIHATLPATIEETERRIQNYKLRHLFKCSAPTKEHQESTEYQETEVFINPTKPQAGDSNGDASPEKDIKL